MTREATPDPDRGPLADFLKKLLTGSGGAAPPPAPNPPPSPSKEPPMQPAQRDWTILLYMAGDNGKVFQTKYGSYSLMAEMTSVGHVDIGEVQKVGTTERVAVLAQFDTLGEHGAYRLEIRQGRTTMEDVVETLPEGNTGDPAELARFIVWGMSRCPARHTMLVLWNHGLGWKDDDIYKTVRSLSRTVRSGRRPRQKNAALFRSTAAKVEKVVADPALDDETRGILCDDSSLDFLTNVEMAQALRVAEVAADEAEVAAIFADEARLQAALSRGPEATRRRLSVIGMDACLMAMVEVHYQVRRFADVMVASQEVEPMAGWPYTEIVSKLNQQPDIGPAQLGELIVHEYAQSYRGTRSDSEVTQSAVDLRRLESDAGLIAQFTDAFRAAYGQDDHLQFAFYKAAQATRGVFEDDEYVDLAAFLRTLLSRYRVDPAAPVAAAGQALLDWLTRPSGPVVANAATGRYQDKAHGASIYLSQAYNPVSPLYKALDFAGLGWHDLLETVRTQGQP
ncbi:MAG: clostripain-related cysteine peptidase [Caldilineales bacterium]|nr:clostripain-related cysteine peptidase [Caldilineales bacterium]